MQPQIHTYQCPACTGPLHFAAGSGRLECEYCGSSYEVAEVEAFYAQKAAAEGICPACQARLHWHDGDKEVTCPDCGAELAVEGLLDYTARKEETQPDRMHWDTQAGGQWQQGEADGLRLYRCQICGGEIVADETTGATTCPYCDNPVVLTGHFSGGLKPDLVIPFQVDKQAAIAALEKHCKGKRLLPKVFKDQNHIEQVKGLYVPVWLFDADADAQVEYRATKIRTWSDSDYDYTETSHYAVFRSGTLGFADVPVDGSTKMDDTLMESIEPFDLSGAVAFQAAYLPGYLADKYDVDADASIARANERIKSSTQEAFRDTVLGYDTVMPVDSQVRLEHGRAKYALYPVWVLNTLWNGQKFLFAINGQTGKIAGDLPMDKGAFWKYLLGVTGAVAALVFAISYGIWL